jgi:DNA-binding NtrC family response regulator
MQTKNRASDGFGRTYETIKSNAVRVGMGSPLLDSDSRNSRTVLVVDDDPFILRYMEKALRMAKYEVSTASNADQALSVLAEQRVDLVLTDIVMPESDGFRLAAQIKECNPDLPVLFMTGALPENDERAQELCKLSVLLRKPFLPQQLWDFVAAGFAYSVIAAGTFGIAAPVR